MDSIYGSLESSLRQAMQQAMLRIKAAMDEVLSEAKLAQPR